MGGQGYELITLCLVWNLKGGQINLDIEYTVIIAVTPHVVSPGCTWLVKVKVKILKDTIVI